jgi:hypothetical protein
MNRALAFVLLTLSTVPFAIGQCAIQPIKPIPPIGCKDVTPECVSDSDGKGHWNWICVPDNAGADTSNNPAWKPHELKPLTPSGANVNTVQTTHHNSVNAPFQEPATAIGVPIGEMDAGEQYATEQLHVIAEAIKNCRPFEEPLGFSADYDQMVAEGFVFSNGSPQNVVWNVERQTSIRAGYEGTIEFSEPSFLRPPLNTDYCNKRGIDKSKCRQRWSLGWQLYRRQADHPDEYRYEFDVTSHGLELSRVFKKTEQTDDEPWVSGSRESDGCASKAIKSTLNNPNNATQTSTPPSAPSAPALPLAATQASLSIESTPSGADIEIDGAFVGDTPSTVNVGPGSHQIAVKKKGFADWTKALNVTGGTVQLNAELEQEPPKQ